MLFNEKKEQFEIDGKVCSFAIGKIARRSQVAIYATMGDTNVLVTINAAPASQEMDYFPLSVEYIEKLYSAGLISSSRFVKRERFPSDEAILKGRIIDRSVRSRFAKDYRDEVQVIIKVLSYDEQNDPVIIATNAVSAGFMIMGLPFEGPISIARVSQDDKDNFYMNYNDVFNSDKETKMNLVIAGDSKRIVNIDADMQEIPEDTVIQAMEFGMKKIAEWEEIQKRFVTAALDGTKKETITYESFAADQDLYSKLEKDYKEEIKKELLNIDNKDGQVLKTIYADKSFEGKYSKQQISLAYEKLRKKTTREIIWSTNKRLDGREFDEIRELSIETGILPRSHGSGLFTRGMTQVLTIAVLDSLKNAQLVQDVGGEVSRRYLHYYEEAPYSYGVVDRIKFVPGRRAIGHGALAEKALVPVLPSEEEFPYMIMLISEIMSENGSSSMASICGSTLALLDAGVPIKKPVAGIALGVMINEKDNAQLDFDDYKLLVDMRDVEDFYGFMDFKVGGTKDGVTAIQMDEKAGGLPLEIFKNAFVKSKEARLKILEAIENTISKPKDLSQYAPKFVSTKIPTDKIGDLIGPGGKNIKDLILRTGADINIDDAGIVSIYSVSDKGLQDALAEVESYGAVAEVGKEYTGKVTRVENYGAFVELSRGLTGLLHVSELGNGEFVKDVSKFVKVGQVMSVVVSEVDREGKIRLKKAKA